MPVINFDTMAYHNSRPYEYPSDPSILMYHYTCPNEALQRLASAASAQGTVLPIEPPLPNSSWTMTFPGPALRCDPLSEPESQSVRENAAAFLETSWYLSDSTWESYTTWYGKLPYHNTTVSDARDGSPNISYSLVPARKDQDRYQGFLVDDDPSFRVAVWPLVWDAPQTANFNGEGVSGSDLTSKSTTLQCGLVNSTYYTTFSYINGNQKVDISVPRDQDENLEHPYGYFQGPSNASCPGLHRGFPPYNETEMEHICDFEPETSRRLAYAAMMDAFFDLLHEDNVVATPLVQTQELSFMSDHDLAIRNSSVQNALIRSGHASVAGLIKPIVAEDRISLARGLEQMFADITVSLMSSPYFQ